MSAEKEIIVFCGPMRAGKSKDLLATVERLKYSKTPYILFKPSLDRHAGDVVTTRYRDISEKAVIISTDKPQEIYDHINLDDLKLPFTVLIDEAHFFHRSLFEIVSDLHSRGVQLVISGLDLDANAKPFGPMGDIMSIATKVNKITAVCQVCRADSTKTGTAEYDPAFETTNVVRTKDTDFYVSLCTRCYYTRKAKQMEERAKVLAAQNKQ